MEANFKETVTRRLTEALGDISKLKGLPSSTDLTKWLYSVRATLRRAFGEDSQQLKTFNSVRYGAMHVIGDPQPTEQQINAAYLRGLCRAEAIIQGILSEVQDFGVGNDDPSEALANHTVEPEVAPNVTNITNIHGDRNIVASGDQVSQQVNTVEKDDIDSLIKYLRTFNMEDDDLDELRHAVSQETSVTSKGQYGSMLGEWLGKMMSKAATGVWRDVSLETASKVLPDALSKFYGA